MISAMKKNIAVEAILVDGDSMDFLYSRNLVVVSLTPGTLPSRTEIAIDETYLLLLL